jgi:hypothetical protein
VDERQARCDAERGVRAARAAAASALGSATPQTTGPSRSRRRPPAGATITGQDARPINGRLALAPGAASDLGSCRHDDELGTLVQCGHDTVELVRAACIRRQRQEGEPPAEPALNSAASAVTRARPTDASSTQRTAGLVLAVRPSPVPMRASAWRGGCPARKSRQHRERRGARARLGAACIPGAAGIPRRGTGSYYTTDPIEKGAPLGLRGGRQPRPA